MKKLKNPHLRYEIIIIAGIAAWTILACSLFMLNRMEIVFAAGERLFQVCLALFIFILAGAAGTNLLRIAKFQIDGFAHNWLLGTGLGLAIIGYLTLFLGLAGLLNRWIYSLVLIFFFIINYNQIRALVYQIYHKIKIQRTIKISPFSLCLISLLSLTALCYLTGALTPEVDYDALEYHLGAATIYLADGSIHFLKHNVYANFPALGEMLYLFGIILDGDRTAKLINYGLGLLCILSIIYFGKRYFSWTVGLCAASIFYIYPLTGLISAQAYIDLAVTFFTFLGLWSIINWFEDNGKGKNKWLVLAGVYCGLASACKYTALLLTLMSIVIMVAFFALPPVKRFIYKRYPEYPSGPKVFAAKLTHGRISNLLGPLICLVGLCILVSSPWYIKNYVGTGNPFYPFFYKIFGGTNWDTARDIRFWKAHLPPDTSLLALMQTPWYMAMRNNTASLLFIFFLPVFLFLRKKGRIMVYLSVFTVVFYLCWFYFTHHVDRFFMPALPGLSLICGYTLFRLKEKRIVSGILKFILVFILIFNLYTFNLIMASISPWGVALGYETEEEFLKRNLAVYQAIKFLNDNMSQTEKVLLVGEARVHYLKVPFLANTVFDVNIIGEIIKKAKTTEQIKQGLESMGVTHLLVNLVEVKRLEQTYSYMPDFNWRLFLEFEQNCLNKVYADGQHGIFIYEIKF